MTLVPLRRPLRSPFPFLMLVTLSDYPQLTVMFELTGFLAPGERERFD